MLIVDANAEPRRPRGRIGWKDVLCVGPIILNTIYYYAGIPLTPLLLGRNPVLLSALRGSISAMVAAGGFARVGKANIVLALIAPIPISMMTDPFFFWAGKRYGRSLINFLSESDPRWRKRAARGDRFFQKYGIWTIILAPFLPAPSPLFYMAAGEAGMPFLVFILADLFGTLAYIGAIVAAGWIIGQPAVTVAQTISNYALYIIVAMVVLIIAVVDLVGMAFTARSDEQALSAGERGPDARRWLTIGACVLIPVTLGAIASSILYATHPTPVIPTTALTPAPVAADTRITDGALLLIEPATTDQIKIPLGQVFEIVLQTGPGQQVISNDSEVLATVTPNPPCDDAALCGVADAGEWTFKAVGRGVGYLTISFGRSCPPPSGACSGAHRVLLKPFAVYTRPQTS